MTTLTCVNVGVDVSKNHLDIYLYQVEKSFRVPNSPTGIKLLIKQLVQYKIAQIVCEATGGYERLMVKTLNQENYQVWCVEPKRIRAFIISEGIKAKTDKIDAKMIALFATQKSSAYKPTLMSDKQEKLRSLVLQKSDLVSQAAEQKTKIQQAYDSDCIKIIKKHLQFLEKQIKGLSIKIDTLIKDEKELSKKAKILGSIPGVGDHTVAITLAIFPEIGEVNDKQAASLTGVAPHIKQSGVLKGYAKIGGGRASLRKVLYMAALTATQYNSTLKCFYQRLIEAGKSFKVAIVAVMRKLIVYMNILIRKSELWNPILDQNKAVLA